MLTTQQSTVIRCDRGFSGIKEMPHSEVCISMRIAGEQMGFHVTESGAVQLYRLNDNDEWQPFSFPIGSGEAGLYYCDEDEEEEFYYYE